MTTELNQKSRAWAEIDLGALLSNYTYAKEKSGRPVMCVVKANAYGHGAVRCAKFLQQHGADAFAVASLAEAIELRGAGITQRILILGYTDPGCGALLARHDLMQTVLDEEHASQLSQNAAQNGYMAMVHIKVDTGMTRTGLYAQGETYRLSAAEAAERICRLPHLSVKGIYTHFAAADTPDEIEFTGWQLQNFRFVIDHLTQCGLKPEVCHASNSAAIMARPDAGLDMVREGIMLYGLYPDSQPHEDGPLKPVMTLKAVVGQVRDIPAGATVSYGRTYKCDAPQSIATVLAGYADGYSRRLSGKGYAVIREKKYAQVGRVCMDMHMVDVTGGGAVSRGDEAILWGAGGMSVEVAANIVGTINYELVSLVTNRCERVYLYPEGT